MQKLFRRTKMISYREILRLHHQGFSQRSIAASCNCGKGTVQRTIEHAKEHGLTWPLPPEMTDGQLRSLFSAAKDRQSGKYKEPDLESIHRKMSKSGVTLSLLWNEYCADCRINNEIPYMYTAFCNLYRSYNHSSKATMHITRRPGEQMEVDWAGKGMCVHDNITGEISPVFIFVAVLSYSGYAYVEGFLSRNAENWISAHVNAYRHFGGSTRILIPDNLKTGVIRADGAYSDKL
jgi:transposase